MSKLESSLANLLATPIEVLNRRFTKAFDTASELRKIDVSRLTADGWRDIHLKLRGHPCEDALWSALMWKRPELPDDVTLDLIARRIGMQAILTPVLSSTVLDRLAAVHPNSRLMIVARYYKESRFSCEEFGRLFEMYGRENAYFRRKVADSVPSSRDKADLLLQIAQDPDLADVIRYVWMNDMESRADVETDPAVIEEMFRVGNDGVLLGLAVNPNASQEILTRLSEHHGKIGAAAKLTLTKISRTVDAPQPYPTPLTDVSIWDGLSIDEQREVAAVIVDRLPVDARFVEIRPCSLGSIARTVAVFAIGNREFELIQGGDVALGIDPS